MIQRPWTLTLTVLGRLPQMTPLGPVRPHRGTGQARRAMLVIRTGDAHSRLRHRLVDSITRLAGGSVVEVSSVVDRILADLLNHRIPWPKRNRWTLAQVQPDPAADPYDRYTATLTVVDAPPRGTASPHRLWMPENPQTLARTNRRVCMS